MSRVPISEYKAKTLLLGKDYQGLQVCSGTRIKKPAKGRWVVKVDQGVKKRFKKGLVAVDVSTTDAFTAIAKWEKKGYSQFILEPFTEHTPSEERYLSLERVRDGIRMIYSPEGGVDIEAHTGALSQYTIHSATGVDTIAQKSGVPKEFLSHLVKSFEQYHFAFVEINPLLIRDGRVIPLDAAVLVDSAGEFFAHSAWTDTDLIRPATKSSAEERVTALDATTPASLKLSIINPHGNLFFLLSGGGGSIVVADQVHAHGFGKALGNYGEYSGGPTREETYLYAKEVVSTLLHSRAPKKALIIAGAVANFTDIKKTFLGIIDALTEAAPALRKQKVKVYVRRGGPNEAAGLDLMRTFLHEEKLFGSLFGSEAVITQAIDDAIAELHL